MRVLNPIQFLWYLLWYRSIVGMKRHLGAPDLALNFWFFRILFLESATLVRKTLSAPVGATLSYINQIFFVSHYHPMVVGNLEVHDPLWKMVHTALAQSLEPEQFQMTLQKNLPILKAGGDMNHLVSEWLLHSWGEYTMGVVSENPQGTDLSYEEYRELRNRIIRVLNKTFYTHRTNFIPILGYFTTRFYRWWHREELHEVDTRLSLAMQKAQARGEGMMVRFQELLTQANQELPEEQRFSEEVLDEVVLDNMFAAPLVYDFLQTIAVQVVLNSVKYHLTNPDHLAQLQEEAIRKGFIFHYRFRWVRYPKDELKKGDFVIANLVKSGQYFSYGPRGCIGRQLFHSMYEQLIGTLKDGYSLTNVDQVQVNRSTAVPEVLSSHELEINSAMTAPVLMIPTPPPRVMIEVAA